MTKILARDHHLKVLHSPTPELIEQSRIAYETLMTDQGCIPGSLTWRCLEELFLVARQDHILYTYKAARRFVETNNRITFFAPILASLFSNSIFIHLYRHPGEFVRSGINRGWYKGIHSHDLGRIVPTLESSEKTCWEQLSDIQKIGWLWNETNMFIETFKQTIAPDRCLTINFNHLDSRAVEEILAFMDITIDHGYLISQLKQKINAQKKVSFPSYENWSIDQRQQLRSMTHDLAKQYGYAI